MPRGPAVTGGGVPRRLAPRLVELVTVGAVHVGRAYLRVRLVEFRVLVPDVSKHVDDGPHLEPYDMQGGVTEPMVIDVAIDPVPG